MKKVLGLTAATVFAMSAFASVSSAATMGENMMAMMQCSGACTTEYLQCVGSAQQLASTPAEGLSQIKTNFDASTACGQAAAACQASCK